MTILLALIAVIVTALVIARIVDNRELKAKKLKLQQSKEDALIARDIRLFIRQEAKYQIGLSSLQNLLMGTPLEAQLNEVIAVDEAAMNELDEEKHKKLELDFYALKDKLVKAIKQNAEDFLLHPEKDQ